MYMKYFVKAVAACALLSYSMMASSGAMGKLKQTEGNEASLYLGGHFSSAGKNTHVNMTDMIGNNYNVSESSGHNGLIGVGYFFNQMNLFHGKIEEALSLPKNG